MATWRTDKKNLIKLSDELNRKGYFEDCNYIPCKITRLNPMCPGMTRRDMWSCDVMGDPLMEDGQGSCSLHHCSPIPLTEAEALERVEFEKQNGRLAYLKKYVYIIETPEAEAELIAHYKKWGWKI